MKQKKFGRNSLCWCGSGRKYKKCHLNRSNEKLDKWSGIKNLKKEFSQKFCLCAKEHKKECQGKIINAHTVSKSSCLKELSRNSHVYAFLLPVEMHIRKRKKNGLIEPELVGINKASTFTGFCKLHDTELFSPIENQSFNKSKEQIFLLSYRALARELFGKIAMKNIEPTLREADKGKNIFEQIQHQAVVSDVGIGVDLANDDLKLQKETFDKALVEEEYNLIEGLVIECNKIPSIMCCGGVLPWFDFNGRSIQNPFATKQSQIYFNILTSEGKGYIVFSWLKEHQEVCNKFINSLLEYEKYRLTDAIIRYVFETFENRFASPNWWEALPDYKKTALLKRFHDAVSLNVDINPNALVEDHETYDDWEISNIEKV